jgi:hypothetical protein
MVIWHARVEIDDREVVLALTAPNAEAAVGRVTADHASGRLQRYATADGKPIDVRWSGAHAVNVRTVLLAESG